MATNVYDREEIVSYDPANPCHYFGWLVTTSSDDFHITGFHMKENREALIAEVGKVLSDRNMKASAHYAAPLAFGVLSAGGDSAEYSQELLQRELSEDFEDSSEAYDFYEDALLPLCEKYSQKDDEDRTKQVKAKQG